MGNNAESRPQHMAGVVDQRAERREMRAGKAADKLSVSV